MHNDSKLIEIRGIGFNNKGAELMLHAILDKIKQEFPNASFTMNVTESSGSRSYERRSKLGFYQNTYLRRRGIDFSFLLSLLPKKLLDMYGIVNISEIDIVLDASGFSYSDQCGTAYCKELSILCKRWKRNGTKVVLLPQAFGPFNNPVNRKNITSIIKDSDLIFARDKDSYDHLDKILPNQKKIQIAGDFTNLIDGIKPKNFNSIENKFAVIPNYRMIDKSNSLSKIKYISFIKKIIVCASELNLRPYILVHHKNDMDLAREIQSEVFKKVNIVIEDDPLVLKGIIGLSEYIFSSRYHGLVSALSQSKMAFGTGWSHKYKMLFDDYNFPDGLLDMNMNYDEISNYFQKAFRSENKNHISSSISKQAEILKNKSMEMWQEVLRIIKDS